MVLPACNSMLFHLLLRDSKALRIRLECNVQVWYKFGELLLVFGSCGSSHPGKAQPSPWNSTMSESNSEVYKILSAGRRMVNQNTLQNELQKFNPRVLRSS
jgi:hypothetical protein